MMPTSTSSSGALLDGPATVRLLLDQGAAIGEAKKPGMQGRAPYAVIPEGHRLEVLPEQTKALAPGGPAHLHDPASFGRYFRDHARPASRIYAQQTPPQFVAVLDDYGPNDQTGFGFEYRSWRAVYAPAFSMQWLLWTQSMGKPMDQAEFAQFLEDQLPDIVSPDGSAIMQAVLNLEISSGGAFVSSLRQQDGSHSLVYRNEHQQQGQLQLPELLNLSIPVFEHQAPVPVAAKLRFRLRADKVAFHYDIVRAQRAIDAAFAQLVSTIETSCALEGQSSPVLRGTP